MGGTTAQHLIRSALSNPHLSQHCQHSRQAKREPSLSTLTIRNLDERTQVQLRIQAARHGLSMEEKARTILRSDIEVRHPLAAGMGLSSHIHECFAWLGGVETELPDRASLPTPAQFDGAPDLET